MLDPVTLAVLKGRLEQIADEMDATLFRAAFNPTIAEAHDACHGIYQAETGATLIQGKSGLPIFVGVMAFGVRAVIEKFVGENAAAFAARLRIVSSYCGGAIMNSRICKRVTNHDLARFSGEAVARSRWRMSA